MVTAGMCIYNSPVNEIAVLETELPTANVEQTELNVVPTW